MRDEVYRNRINIKKNTLQNNLDQRKSRPRTTQTRAIMRSVVDYVKEQGRGAGMVGDMTIISGLKYTFDRIKTYRKKST